MLNTGIETAFYILAFILQLAIWSSVGEKDHFYFARGRNIAAGVS